MKNIYLTFSLILAIFLCSTSSSIAQEKCGTMLSLEQDLKDNPEIAKRMADIEAQTQKWIKNSSVDQKSGEVYTIPVVVHVLYNQNENHFSNISEEKILSQIEILNEDYRRLNPDADETREEFLDVAADVEIEFCLAVSDPNGFPTSGITRTYTEKTVFHTGGPENNDSKSASTGGVDSWPTDQYLNMWIVRGISGHNGTDYDPGVLGYAQFPGGDPNTSGVVVVYNVFGNISPLAQGYRKGRTTVHEIGHWLNLRHIWGDGPCGTDDGVDDTPPSDAANYGCPTSHNSCSSENPDLKDMIENYMDYTNDDCQNIYTIGQKERMRALFEPGNERHSLLSSNACQVAELGANDAAIVDLVYPDGAGNCTALTPIISLYNQGSGDLTSLDISYSIDDDVTNTYNWTGSLAPNTTTEVELPEVVISGEDLFHDIVINLSNPNESADYDDSDNELSVSFAAQLPGLAYLENEDFEGSSFPPSKWDKAGNRNFVLNEQAGAGSSQSAFIENSNYDGEEGDLDELIVADIDMAGWTTANLHFDLAYALENAGDEGDKLQIMVSTDCGESFLTVYDRSGDVLATADPTSAAFIPNDGDWRTEKVDLSLFVGYRNVTVKFVQIRGNGNNLYLDNISILDEITGINNPLKSDIQLEIQPNPAVQETQLSFTMEKSSSLQWSLTDRSGRILQTNTIDALPGKNQFKIDVTALPAGIYFVIINTGTQQYAQKLLVN